MINERMQELINTVSKGNKRAFSNLVGVTPTVLENIVGKRQGKPGYDLLEKIAFAIENLNLDWLLTGRGTMFNNVHQLPQEQNQPSISAQASIDQAQIVKMFMDKINEKDCKIDQLQIELRTAEKELIAIKAKLSNYESSPPPCNVEKETSTDLCNARNACLDITTQKPSSPTLKEDSVIAR